MVRELRPAEQRAYRQYIEAVRADRATRASLRAVWLAVEAIQAGRVPAPLLDDGQPASAYLVWLCVEELRLRQPF